MSGTLPLPMSAETELLSSLSTSWFCLFCFDLIYGMLGNHMGKTIRVLSWGLSRVKVVWSDQAVELKPTVSISSPL